MQVFTEYTLYVYTGCKDNTPDGFEASPSLVDYLNYLAEKGLTIFQVLLPKDSMWYLIITVENKSTIMCTNRLRVEDVGLSEHSLKAFSEL